MYDKLIYSRSYMYLRSLNAGWWRAVTTVPCRFIGRAREGHELIGFALIGDLGSSLAVTVIFDIQHTLAPTLKRYAESWWWDATNFL